MISTIAALDHQEAADLVAEALDSGVRHRIGVAQVASANVAKPECRAWCEAMLIELFNDEDADVRNETAACFSRLPDEALERYVFRTYQQHQNDEWTSRSLDLIDRLCLESMPGTGSEFEQFDRL